MNYINDTGSQGEEEILVADAVMASDEDSARLCTDCGMDYEDAESKSFQSGFEEREEDGGDKGLQWAKTKLTEIWVLLDTCQRSRARPRLPACVVGLGEHVD